MGRDEISLLEELVQLTVKSSLVVPSESPTLLCSVWTRKSYNPDSFRAQLKSIWKTRKKFEIQVAGQNLFLISFEIEDDLEMILKGRPWLFRRQLVIFDQLECNGIPTDERDKLEDELPYSLALKAESSLLEKESLKSNFSTKKSVKQCSYIGDVVVFNEVYGKFSEDGTSN
ncbi:hypothetical protein GOBAR_AA04967 [Gossypium barbadense]|uniref:DUF4283 domain-containing protein n=1 Tax=Gossypium barbadense TaxID=3634 RepID=A0A2P5YJ53_GOSBA|nr:hypothetical protein GOBAR_AA04967 [Gossypium barbadense]